MGVVSYVYYMSSKYKLIFTAWLIATISTAGSLFFSDVMGFIPCTLCWYQRIFMYPLVLILGIGFFTEDHTSLKYAIPLTIVGLLVSVYHNLLQWKIIPETASPCKVGVPCAAKYIDWLGFITIPFLSMVAFLLITIIFVLINKQN